jgi:hypothetical protein
MMSEAQATASEHVLRFIGGTENVSRTAEAPSSVQNGIARTVTVQERGDRDEVERCRTWLIRASHLSIGSYHHVMSRVFELFNRVEEGSNGGRGARRHIHLVTS